MANIEIKTYKELDEHITKLNGNKIHLFFVNPSGKKILLVLDTFAKNYLFSIYKDSQEIKKGGASTKVEFKEELHKTLHSLKFKSTSKKEEANFKQKKPADLETLLIEEDQEDVLEKGEKDKNGISIDIIQYNLNYLLHGNGKLEKISNTTYKISYKFTKIMMCYKIYFVTLKKGKYKIRAISTKEDDLLDLVATKQYSWEVISAYNDLIN